MVGAGAVGIGLGATLLAAGEPVCFVAREPTGAALRSRGCARTGLFGEARFAPADFGVLDGVAAWPERGDEPTAIWVATKSWAGAEVAKALCASPVLRDGSAPIVLAQNGLGNAETFAERLPRARICNAAVITGFRRPELHCAQVTVHAGPILLGSLFGADPARLAPLAEALRRGGIPSGISADFVAELWAKALYNCALNPLGALLGVPYGELGRRPETRTLMAKIVEEVFAVLRAEGDHTRWPDAAAYLEHFHASLLPPTADHESSMLQDVRAGRRTEIDALCGEVARRGARRGVPTPVNEALTVLVRALEESAREADRP